MNMPEFKDMLKYFRMREKLSQSELAEKLGVSASRIGMYEAGKREPDFETEERIADFFNTDLNTLRGRDVETHNSFILHANLKTAVELFESLDDTGQDMAIDNMRIIQKVHSRYAAASDNIIPVAPAKPLVNAAQPRTDIKIPEDVDTTDNDIMQDKDF